MTSPTNPNDASGPLTAALADRYRMEREIGVGGMATVYLAYDVRHARPVAIKVLHPDLAAAIGPERFLAEIRTTAQLQHAHILGLIDSGEVNGRVFYVMPYVDGESLRQRLEREKQLPVADAVKIATALAGALDYAHRRGVIHRDIKPDNILLHEGQALLVDFGIALAVTRRDDGRRLTEHGMSLGTPAYMSPEQTMGERGIDARSDIYALGCVLYEMLTGEPPFTGATGQAIIARVMTAEPEAVTTLRRAVPGNVNAATMTALQKLPADRFATAADFAAALNNPQYVAPDAAAATARRVTAGASRGRDVAAMAIMLALAAAAIAAWFRPGAQQNTLIARFDISIPDTIFSSQFSLSPDGTRLVWSNQSGYYERRLDSLSPRRVRGATGLTQTIRDFAPSGDNVLVSGRGNLSIAPLAGGPARVIVTNGVRSGAWGSDANVYFGVSDANRHPRGIGRVRADGGTVDTVITTDAPVFDISALPDSRGLIAALGHNGASELAALDLRTMTVHYLGVTGAQPQFVLPGYLVFVSGGSIMAAPFNLGKLALSRAPIAVETAPSGSVATMAARRDAMAYLTTPDQTGSGVVVRFANGAIRQVPNIPDSLRYAGFALSPDGKRIVMTGVTLALTGSGPILPVSNLYLYELASGRLTRLRSDQRDQSPAWFPGSRDLSFVRVNTDTPATSTLMRRSWDGGAGPVALLQRQGGGRGGVLGPVAWLPDGRHAVLRVAQGGPGGRGGPPGDLMRLSLDHPAVLDTVVATEYAESNPAVSPDGRLLAFTSDESGQTEVYVRLLSGGAMHRASINGGTLPRWGHNGRGLFYVNGDTLFSTDVRGGADLLAGEVKVVLTSKSLNQGYAVLQGDTSFISAASPPNGRLIVVTNFGKVLERVLATP